MFLCLNIHPVAEIQKSPCSSDNQKGCRHFLTPDRLCNVYILPSRAAHPRELARVVIMHR
eukprot:m.835763 g.835763  ORF g.835763 m.835763 type:complete len:60 (+) comp23455_c0_seq51:419-598(+)